ncbi:hypothetical protein O4H49_03475 [Kiloniella laminariae]|uniref:Uncharacterized protein n=1 Tax=Kiloniella laminariae TaxID=454162 RepID=A0ABT4LFE1_9PROT|nr:hypothetical protein [Kiloniella laminariae]MCZ4279823.1 hypothetical protein [Kiloniella laminariae]
MKNEIPEHPKSPDTRPSTRGLLSIGSFLILAGIALYFYAMSGPASGVAMAGIFWGLLALSGWGLIALGLLVFCWIALRKIISAFRRPSD